MLTETQQRLATRFAADYFSDIVLREAVLKMAMDESLEAEFGLLNALIDKVNTPTLDPDFTNTAKLLHELSIFLPTPLPHIFNWSDRHQKHLWTKSLLETLSIVNSEIDVGYHTNPKKIDGGNPSDVFRFYLLDGYARWIATNATGKRNIDQDRRLAETVINSLCESAVALAEENDSKARDLVGWVINHGWIKEECGFTKNLVVRANKIASN